MKERILRANVAAFGTVRIREAKLDDVGPIRDLIQKSARALALADYTSEQIEAALKGAWGVDTQLIKDETYFVVECEGMLAACGGWSRRRTLFGSDAHAGRQPDLLEPATESARIRAFFVHPNFARRGAGRMLLERCEKEAKSEGFGSAELVATLPGLRFYQACGYEAVVRETYSLDSHVSIDFVTMRKAAL